MIQLEEEVGTLEPQPSQRLILALLLKRQHVLEQPLRVRCRNVIDKPVRGATQHSGCQAVDILTSERGPVAKKKAIDILIDSRLIQLAKRQGGPPQSTITHIKPTLRLLVIDPDCGKWRRARYRRCFPTALLRGDSGS